MQRLNLTRDLRSGLPLLGFKPGKRVHESNPSFLSGPKIKLQMRGLIMEYLSSCFFFIVK